MKTTLVGFESAASHFARSLPRTNSVVTPHFGKNSVSTTWQDENIDALATTRSPFETKQATEANMAAIPLLVATHRSAPSKVAKRDSNIPLVGLAKRPYR